MHIVHLSRLSSGHNCPCSILFQLQDIKCSNHRVDRVITVIIDHDTITLFMLSRNSLNSCPLVLGYGTITPKTDAGRVITIFYALIGIPLTVLCITNIGRAMASLFRALYGGTFCVECRQQFFQTMKNRRTDSIAMDDLELDKVEFDVDLDEKVEHNHNHSEVPIAICLILVLWYIVFGATMFKLWEETWSIFDGAYFCFITLSTIGFGDIVPGFSHKDWDNQAKQVACSLYLLIGLSTLAMCFDLIQQRGTAIANNFGRFIGLVKDEDD